jgi:hypothetical protein
MPLLLRQLASPRAQAFMSYRPRDPARRAGRVTAAIVAPLYRADREGKRTVTYGASRSGRDTSNASKQGRGRTDRWLVRMLAEALTRA